MPHSFELKFTGTNNAVFLVNQVLAGTIELKITKPMKARGLRLIIKGKSECEWSKTRSRGKYQETVHYFGKEVYLDTVSYLFGSPNGETIELPAGVHTYNFACHLPGSLPYSMEGRKGFIRYKAEATLDIPWGFDYESKKPFTVVRHDNFNEIQYANYRQPCELEKIRTFGCLCWKSKPLIMTLRVPKTGFGLGEKIPIDVVMINRSSTDVCSTEFRLMQIELFNSTSPVKTKIYESTVALKFERGVDARKAVTLNVILEIPRVLPTSNSRFCKIFQVKYHINFKARTGCCVQSIPDMNIHIAIGNVGILDNPAINFSEFSTTAPAQPSAPQDDLRE